MRRADYAAISDGIDAVGQGFGYAAERRRRERERQQALRRELERDQGAREERRNRLAIELMLERRRAEREENATQEARRWREQQAREARRARADAESERDRTRREALGRELLQAGLAQHGGAAMGRPTPPAMAKIEETTETGSISYQRPLEEVMEERRRNQEQTEQALSPEGQRRAMLQQELNETTRARASGGEYPGMDAAYRIPGVGHLGRMLAGPSRSERMAQLQQELGGGQPGADRASTNSAPRQITTKEEYDALPRGARFVFNGREGIKQ